MICDAVVFERSFGVVGESVKVTSVVERSERTRNLCVIRELNLG